LNPYKGVHGLASKVWKRPISFTPGFSPVTQRRKHLETVSTVSGWLVHNFFGLNHSVNLYEGQTVKTVSRIFSCCSSPG